MYSVTPRRCELICLFFSVIFCWLKMASIQQPEPMDESTTVMPGKSAAAATNNPNALEAAISASSAPWDPLACRDWDSMPSTFTCLNRIKRDVMSIYNDPPHGIFVVPDTDDMTLIHALIIGPFDTPYEGGFFYFLVKCPPDYPIRPPRVRLMTTGDGTVRFNPNLYRNGKVCLSILGTWSGPCWSPAQSLASVLVSIQSLLNENPYHNEPGFENDRSVNDSARYNQIVRHETLRVAVCDMLEGRGTAIARCPQALRDVMAKSFGQFYDTYMAAAEVDKHLDGTVMSDPFQEKRGSFQHRAVIERLRKLRERLATLQSPLDSAASVGARGEKENKSSEESETDMS